MPRDAVYLAEKVAYGKFRDRVQPYRRLVEVEYRRPVQKRRRQIASHSLPERQLPYRRVKKPAEVHKRHHLIQVAPVRVRRDTVYLPQQFKRLDDRQVPPQLCPLAEYHPEPPDRLYALLPRDKPQHLA